MPQPRKWLGSPMVIRERDRVGETVHQGAAHAVADHRVTVRRFLDGREGLANRRQELLAQPRAPLLVPPIPLFDLGPGVRAQGEAGRHPLPLPISASTSRQGSPGSRSCR